MSLPLHTKAPHSAGKPWQAISYLQVAMYIRPCMLPSQTSAENAAVYPSHASLGWKSSLQCCAFVSSKDNARPHHIVDGTRRWWAVLACTQLLARSSWTNKSAVGAGCKLTSTLWDSCYTFFCHAQLMCLEPILAESSETMQDESIMKLFGRVGFSVSQRWHCILWSCHHDFKPFVLAWLSW